MWAGGENESNPRRQGENWECVQSQNGFPSTKEEQNPRHRAASQSFTRQQCDLGQVTLALGISTLQSLSQR